MIDKMKNTIYNIICSREKNKFNNAGVVQW